jgi:dTDP-4-dehydrorhamnose 3,5-epimerase
MLEPRPDQQTVTPDGEPVAPRIDGVRLRPAKTHLDDRGELCEIFNPDWGFHEDPLVYAYQLSIRPGKIKGWVVHREQDDRLFISLGTVKIVLYDDRAASPTRGMINEIYLGEHNRALITIPHGVYHALQNVGLTDAYFVNLPTRAFNHAQPDKHRLPVGTDQIPYRFDELPGR